MPTLRTVAATALAGAGLLASPALAQTPSLSAHTIFGGGHHFHVGAVAQPDAHAKIAKLCVTPAPIDRPDCSDGTSFAPSAAGLTHLKATFADGATATATLRVHPAATKIGGTYAVPGHATCATTTLYGNYNQRTHRYAGRHGQAKGGARLAIYNKVGPGRFVWVYGTNAAGFAKPGCFARG